MADAVKPVLLRATGIAKSFGGTQALQGVTLEVRGGEVHALLGENGAGKSTLIKVLAGVHAPDAGMLSLDGTNWQPRDPAHAIRSGIVTIHQELSVLGHLTVAQNLLLHRLPRTWFGTLDRGAMRAEARQLLAQVGREDLSPDARLDTLAPADRQMVEIARAIGSRARVIVMDEPTSSLGAADVERLFCVVRMLREQGMAIVYVSHFLEEVRAICDRFTVLTDGRAVASGLLAEVTDAQLVRHMTGRDVTDLYPPRREHPGDVVLRVEHLAGRTLPSDASLELRRGEILGIGGLCGAGRTELLEALFGLGPVRSGALQLLGRNPSRGVRARWRAGLGMVVEDRKQHGLALARSLAFNLILPAAGQVASRLGWISPRRMAEASRPWIDRFGVRCSDPLQPIGSLSGGNQQKVAIARLLHAGAEVLLLDEPTRGIDVGSRQAIYRLLDAAARRGAAILVVSSQLPELLGLCDRIAIMARGRLGPWRDAAACTQESLLHEALGTPMEAA